MRGRMKKIVRYLDTDLKVRVYLGVVRVIWKIVLKSLVNTQAVVL